MQRAEASLRLADASLGEARLLALRSGGIRYIDWVGAGLRRQIVQSLLNLAKTRDEALSVRVQRGDIPAIERVDNQRALWQRQGLLVSAQRGIELAALEPVSYTHLDVYKRQCEDRSSGHSFCKRWPARRSSDWAVRW